MLGEFLEISVQVPDVLASLDFYEQLGFRQCRVTDAWSHRYAAVSDGRLHIGLHEYEFPSPSLTFVLPDLRVRISTFEELGLSFAFSKLDENEFNEFGFYDPDGQMITLLEARTFSPVAAPDGGTGLGFFDEYLRPVRDVDLSRAFYERLGFIAEGQDKADYISVFRDGIDIGLHQASTRQLPALVFTEADMDMRIRTLEGRGFDCKRAREGIHSAATLQSPEGLPLLLLARE